MITRSKAAVAAIAVAAIVGSAALLERAESFTVPDLCGGVSPCPPPCLGAPEVARSPAEFIEKAAYQLGPPQKIDLPPANLTMPPFPDPKNVYSETVAGKFSPATAGRAVARLRAQPHGPASVDVIDPETFKVVDSFVAVPSAQHIVPSWDLQTLWVSGDISYRGGHASVMPIDPKTGKPGKAIDVPDSYNMYFTPDGRSAIVVAEAMRRLEFRDPHTMALQGYIDAPNCAGINHADFSLDGSYAIFTCEYNDKLAKIDLVHHTLAGMLQLSPQAHSAGHPRLARRLGLLRRRHAAGRPDRHRRRQVQGDRLHQDRRRHARPLSEPRRQEALHLQPRHAQPRAAFTRARAACR